MDSVIVKGLSPVKPCGVQFSVCSFQKDSFFMLYTKYQRLKTEN